MIADGVVQHHIRGVLSIEIKEDGNRLRAEVYANRERAVASLTILGFKQDPIDPDVFWAKKKEASNG